MSLERLEARDATPAIPLAEQIACVARELAMRGNVYRRRVAQGSFTQATADLEIARMTAVLETLKGLQS